MTQDVFISAKKDASQTKHERTEAPCVVVVLHGYVEGRQLKEILVGKPSRETESGKA